MSRVNQKIRRRVGDRGKTSRHSKRRGATPRAGKNMNQTGTKRQSRRQVIAGATVALAAAATAGPLARKTRAQKAGEASASEPFKYCLNTSTIRGQNIGIAAEVELASKVGFHGLEP